MALEGSPAPDKLSHSYFYLIVAGITNYNHNRNHTSTPHSPFLSIFHSWPSWCRPDKVLEESRGPPPKGWETQIDRLEQLLKGSETQTGGFELALKGSGTQAEGFELLLKGSETGAEGLDFEPSWNLPLAFPSPASIYDQSNSYVGFPDFPSRMGNQTRPTFTFG